LPLYVRSKIAFGHIEVTLYLKANSVLPHPDKEIGAMVIERLSALNVELPEQSDMHLQICLELGHQIVMALFRKVGRILGAPASSVEQARDLGNEELFGQGRSPDS
jgi:hypothetical protein